MFARPYRRAGAALLALACAVLVTASDEPESLVTCGSVIKLQHANTKYRLHSHEIAYGSGSGQQSVTGFPDGEDSNSYWVVRPPLGASCEQGKPVAHGSTIRLQHLETRRWLHSHSHRSPLSGQQEVSAYGDEHNSNSNDVWRVECDGVWEQNEKVSLVHVDTGVYLHSHAREFPRPIAGQHEVCGAARRTRDAEWIAAEGVFFPDRSAAGHRAGHSEL